MLFGHIVAHRCVHHCLLQWSPRDFIDFTQKFVEHNNVNVVPYIWICLFQLYKCRLYYIVPERPKSERKDVSHYILYIWSISKFSSCNAFVFSHVSSWKFNININTEKVPNCITKSLFYHNETLKLLRHVPALEASNRKAFP